MTSRQVLLAAVRALGFVWLALPVQSRLMRLVAGGLLAMLVVPLVGDVGVGPLGVEILHEAMAGAALGLVASVPWRAAMGGGALLDHWRRPDREDGLLTTAWLLLGLGIFASVDGPRLWVEGFARSYLALPAGQRLAGVAISGLLDAGARLVGAAVMAAAPILIAALGAEVVIEVVRRTAPSLRLGGDGRLREPLLVLVLGLTAAGVLLAMRDGMLGTGRSLIEVARMMGR